LDKKKNRVNQKAAVAVLIIAVVMCFSATMTAQAETVVYPPIIGHFDTSQQFALSAPLVIGITTQASNPLDQPTRADIYQYVADNPGVHFRGICDALSLSVGMVQYHLGVLVCAGFLSVYGDGKMQRFFVASKYGQQQMKLISLLRHKTKGQILQTINSKKTVTHSELAVELEISSQGLTWQMHQLKREGVVEATSNGLKLNYQINQTYTETVNQAITLLKQS